MSVANVSLGNLNMNLDKSNYQTAFQEEDRDRSFKSAHEGSIGLKSNLSNPIGNKDKMEDDSP